MFKTTLRSDVVPDLEEYLQSISFLPATDKEVGIHPDGKFTVLKRPLPNGHAPQDFCLRGEVHFPLAVIKRVRNRKKNGKRPSKGTLVMLSAKSAWYRKYSLADDEREWLAHHNVTISEHIWR